MLISQNSMEQQDLGVASSTATFFCSIGGSFGVSLFGAIFNHRLTAELATRLGTSGGPLTTGGAHIDPATLKQLPTPIHTGVLQSLAAATSNVFVWAALFAALIPVLAALLRHIPLRDSLPPADTSAAPDGDTPKVPAKTPHSQAEPDRRLIGIRPGFPDAMMSLWLCGVSATCVNGMTRAGFALTAQQLPPRRAAAGASRLALPRVRAYQEPLSPDQPSPLLAFGPQDLSVPC
jgi:hypothetical protein